MSNLIVLICCLLMTSVALAAPVTAPVVQDKVKDHYVPVEFGQVRLEGLLGQRMKTNLEERLLKVDEAGILEGFRNRPGKQAWIGEHAGKFLHAAANTYAYTHDPRLKTLMDRVAHELVKTQRPDGYLGTYANDKRWISWDVWVHKYDLLGLLRHYEVTGDKQSLDAARKIGDLMHRTFGDGRDGAVQGRDLGSTGEHMGMASTSILEPMCTLYRDTGEKRYLDFCLYITRAIESNSKVISNLNSTGRVYGTANNKAYEMLSNLVGLTELYRITGDETYLTPVTKAWEDIVKNRLYVTGTGSSQEHWQADGYLPAENKDKMGEGCVTVTWMQLNLSLQRLTGEAKYADELERSIYNHLLGAQRADNGDVSYYTPLMGFKQPVHEINCCLSSVPRGVALIPQAVCGVRDDREVLVNLYNPGKATVQLFKQRQPADVAITIGGDFPKSGEIKLTFAPSRRVDLIALVRIPGWADDMKITGAPGTIEAKPGSYARIQQTVEEPLVITLSTALKPHKLDGGPTYPGLVGTQRGPQVMCVDASRPGSEEIPFADAMEPRVWLKPDGTAPQVARPAAKGE